MPPKDDAYLKIQSYLEKHKKQLQEQNVDYIVWELKTYVPETKELLEGELGATVMVWRSLNGPIYPLSTTPPLTLPDSKLVDTVKDAVKTVIKGVDLKRGAGRINLGVKGLTAELAKGDASVAVRRSWGGTLSIEAKKGDFHLAGQLSADEWQVTLSYPEDSYVPDLSTVSKVFSEGEKAMRGSLVALGGFDNLLDADKVQKAIAPAIKPLTEAVDATRAASKARPKGGVGFGFKIGSPPPVPGGTERPAGVQGVIFLRLTF